MKKMLKRLCTGFLALATVVTTLPTTPVHAESKQYWTESKERVGIVEKVMNDGSIGSTFNEGHLTVEGEDAYCIDINTDFRNGYKTRIDASTRMSADQISDVALSIEYVKQYTDSHSGISNNHAYLLRQLVVWQRLSVHLGWQCDNVRASYDEIPKATQDEVFSGARAFVKENKGRYECGGYIYSGEGQELGQFWAKLNIGNAKLKKATSNTSITDGNGNYSIAGATYGVFSDKNCTKQLATLTTDENGNTDVVEVKAGTVYIKELSAPAGYKVDKTVYSLKVEAGKTATLKVSDTPKVTDTLIELFKIDMETQKDNPQGNASLAGAEFTWKYYAGFYNKDNLPAEATRTWVTKTIAETDSDGSTHYITKFADAYKVSGDSFYMQDGKAVLPLGTLTVEETKAPNGYLLDGAYMQAGDKSEQIKDLYLTQITEDGDLAVLSGSNQFSVSDKVIRGGVKIQKRDLETGDTKPQGSATLKDTAFDIISLNDNAVLVEGKLYKKNEVVKTIRTDIEGIASTSADLLPYGNFRIVESEAPDGYLTDGAKPIDFTITENGKIVDLTDEAHSIYNQIKRGDIEGVKILYEGGVSLHDYENCIRIGKELQLCGEANAANEIVTRRDAAMLLHAILTRAFAVTAPAAPVTLVNAADVNINDYLLALWQVPEPVLAAFNVAGWTYCIDFDYMGGLSKKLNMSCIGATNYSQKTIYISEADATLHEFGHFLDYALGFPAEHERLYLAESQNSSLRDYAKTNSREFFADCFVHWITYSADKKRMDDFRDAAPQTYAYMKKLATNNWGA